MNFGGFVKKERRKKKMKRKELGRLSWVREESIKAIEDEGLNTTVKTADRICRALGVTYTLGEVKK